MGSNRVLSRLISTIKGTGNKGKEGFLGVVVSPKEPVQGDAGGRSWGAGASILPKVWDRTYGEHTARELSFMSYKEPTTRSSIHIILQEKNRRGLIWKEEYAAVCPKCGKEYPALPEKQEVDATDPTQGDDNPPPQNPLDPHDPLATAGSEPDPSTELSSPGEGAEGEEAEKEEEVYHCEEPGCEGILETPDPEEYRGGDELLEHPVPTDPQVSLNHLQNVHDRDVLTLGNGYYFAMNQYHLGVSGEIIDDPDLKDADGEPMVTTPRGITTAPEEMIRKVEDDFGHKGGLYWVCLSCRDKYDNYRPERGSRDHPPKKCSHCDNTRLYDVHVIVSPTGEDIGDGVTYFIEGEYHWTPFFADGLRFSLSPIETLSDPIMIKIYGYRYWLNIYRTKQSNNVLKWVAANSLNSFKEFVNFMKQAWSSKEEAWIMADSEAKGQPAGAIKLDYDAQQLDAVSQNDQLDNYISILYGVTPSNRGSTEGGVGLGNDSMDVTIQASRVQGYQDISNEGFCHWYAKDLWGIKAWRLEHVPPEPDNDTTEEERIDKVLGNAEKALKLGIKVERREGTDRLENVYTGQYKDPNEMKGDQNPFGDEGDEQDIFGEGQGPDMFGGPSQGGDAFGGKRPPQFGGFGNEIGTAKKAWISTGSKTPPKGVRTKKGPKGGIYYWGERSENDKTNGGKKSTRKLKPEEIQEDMKLIINVKGRLPTFAKIISVTEDEIIFENENGQEREIYIDDLETADISIINEDPKEKLLVTFGKEKSKTLYRVADNNFTGSGINLAENKEDALAYLANSGFGGANLYEVEVEYDRDQIIDVGRGNGELREIFSDVVDTKGEDPISFAEETTGRNWPFSAWEEFPEVKEELIKRGYKIVAFEDDYPEGAQVYAILEDPEDDST